MNEWVAYPVGFLRILLVVVNAVLFAWLAGTSIKYRTPGIQ
ncbi:MAG TPA: hypothetical protein VIW94_01395 [Acidimicrobiia bacterium]